MGESSADYIDKLLTCIQEKGVFINEFVIDSIKEAVSEYRKTFETMLNTLINAGHIAPNRYGDRLLLNELKRPSEDEIHQNSLKEELSIRLSDYLGQLSFIENHQEVSLEYLTTERVMKLKSMFEYIDWGRITQSSISPNEKALAEIEQIISGDEDKLCRNIFRDSKNRLSKLSYTIKCGLEDIATYLRENYKLEIRERVMPAAGVDADLIVRNQEEAILLVKKCFKTEMGEKYFDRALIKEIFREDFGVGAADLQAAVLNSLKQHKTIINIHPAGNENDEEDNTGILLEGFRLLSGAGAALINIAEKLKTNVDIVENRKLTFLQRLFSYFRSKPKTEREPLIYTIIIFNPNDETGRKIHIDFNKYISDLSAEGQLLLSFSNKDSKQMNDLSSRPPELLTEELKKHLKILYVSLTRLPAVDRTIRDRASNAMLGSMKGIKLDLNDIQSGIIKSNKRRLEHKTRLSARFD